MNTLTQHQLQLHIPVVAWLMILGHAFFLFFAVGVFLLLAGVGVAIQEETATPIFLAVGALAGVSLGMLALPGIVAGFGLLAHKQWARFLAIVVAMLSMINIPIGTLMGLYSAWVLLQDEASVYFTGSTRAELIEASPAFAPHM